MRVSFFRSIKFKIFAVFFLLILIICATMFFFMNQITTSLITTNELDKLKNQSANALTMLNEQYPGDWKAMGDLLYKGDTMINNNTDFPDYIKSQTGLYCTLFSNDVRISTNVQEKGQRAVGTKAEAAVTKTVLKQGKIYAGRVSVAGIDSLAYYTPIKDRSGNVVGMFFVGVASTTAFQKINAFNMELLIISLVFLVIGTLFVFLLSLYLTRPISKISHLVREISLGHLNSKINVKSKDELGMISVDLNRFTDYLSHDVVGSMKKIADGDMSVAIQSKDDQDEISPVLMNTIETVNSIVNETSSIIRAAEAGRLDARCSEGRYQGSWAMLAGEINKLVDHVQQPVEEACAVVRKMAVNDYAMSVTGDYEGVFKELAEAINEVRKRLLHIQDDVTHIARGETERLDTLKSIGRLSENDTLTPALILMMQTIQSLIDEIQRVTLEGTRGNIMQVRGNAEAYEGGFREIVEGINQMLDGISKPMADFMAIINAMAVNDYTSDIPDNYQGDYKTFRDAIENVTKRLLTVQSVAIEISKGDISRLETFKSIGRRSENDKLLPAFTLMMENIQALIGQATSLADSAARGELGARGDETKFEGGYASVVRSVNHLLDAVERPVSEISDVMHQLNTSGRLDVHISGEYEGSFKSLTDSINATVGGLKLIIGQVAGAITEMSQGNFGIPPLREYPGDYRAFTDTINLILDSLNDLLGNIHITSEQVASGSSQVSSGSQQLSSGATEQASAVEELTETVTRIADQTRKNATAAGQANSLAVAVKENAASSTVQMENMLRSMTEIGQASADVSKIIKLIDDVAFQTNILALNAAVEAARAGQYGKGFAVVAEEVRNLAEKSAQAASQTAGLIESTIRKVKDGTQVANGAADAINSILQGVNEMSGLVADISAASGEQATGIARIDSSLQQVSQVIQTVSATSEQSAAASEELSGQADLLKQQVSKFTLRETA